MSEDAIQWLTYAEIAQAFGIGADSARNLVRRKRWSRKTGNDGLARVGVPLNQVAARTEPPIDVPTSPSINPPTDGHTSPPIDGPTDGALVALEILRDHIGRLETEIAGLKGELDQERGRAAQVAALTAILEIEKARTTELREERDKWSGMAEAAHRQLEDLSKRPRGLLGWLKRA